MRIVAGLLCLASWIALAACQAPAATPTSAAAATLAVPGSVAPATGTPAASEVLMSSPVPTPTGPFRLTSPAFVEGGSIPWSYTCDGQNTSPPLEWSGAPDGTATLALVMTDPDAGGFVHWVFFNVEASVSGGIPAGFSSSPDGPPQGLNGFGREGYGGPCPPSGTHHYVFRLLALDSALPLTGTPKASAVLDAAQGHVLGEAKLTGTYKRGS